MGFWGGKEFDYRVLGYLSIRDFIVRMVSSIFIGSGIEFFLGFYCGSSIEGGLGSFVVLVVGFIRVRGRGKKGRVGLE